MSSDMTDDGLQLETLETSGMVLSEQRRNEKVVTVMVKEIDSVKQRINDLHSVGSWIETVASAAFGVFVSGVFQLISNAAGSPPLWCVVGAWVLTIVSALVAIISLLFRQTLKNYEQEQKTAICKELESWKRSE